MRFVLVNFMPGPGSFIRPPLVIPSPGSGLFGPLPVWVYRAVRR